jgi:hypothetical protein
MNKIISAILRLIGLAAAIGITGFLLDKAMKKFAANKYRREFKLMCYSVAQEISSRCW